MRFIINFVFLVLLFSFISSISSATNRDYKPVECLDINFKNCLEKISSDFDVNIEVTDTSFNQQIVNFENKNATLQNSIVAVLKSVKAKNYFIHNTSNSDNKFLLKIHFIEPISFAFNNADAKFDSLSRKSAGRTNGKNDITSDVAIGNQSLSFSNSSFSEDEIRVLDKETQVIIQRNKDLDIIFSQEHLDSLQIQTDQIKDAESIKDQFSIEELGSLQRADELVSDEENLLSPSDLQTLQQNITN